MTLRNLASAKTVRQATQEGSSGAPTAVCSLAAALAVGALAVASVATTVHGEALPGTVQQVGREAGAQFQLSQASLRASAPVTTPAAFHDATPPNLPTPSEPILRWGDYDNDGLLDFALVGQQYPAPAATHLYHNDGGGLFHDATPPGMVGIFRGDAQWGDYDNDGRLDLLVVGDNTNGYQSRLYHNDGGGAFHEVAQTGIAGTDFAQVAWADYDNDGRLDVSVMGYQSFSGNETRLYHNDGGGAFHEATPLNFPQVDIGHAAWGDYDNDGRLDFLITGEATTGIITRLYHNDGGGTFHDTTPSGIQSSDYASIAWGDYDNDGFLDFFLTGGLTALTGHLFHNDGGGTFHEVTQTGLLGPILGDIAWGDYDNDGLLDLVVSGYVGNPYGTYATRLYHNEGGGHFTDSTPLDWPALTSSSLAWGDYDNDNRLDLLLGGAVPNTSTYVVHLYHNDAPLANTPPGAPGTLTASAVTISSVTLSWSAAIDPQTPSSGLSYNLRVGTSPGGLDVVSPMANTANGVRRLSAPGPERPGLNATLGSLLPGHTYYWSVQAVDPAWAGGPFAAEGQFTTLGGSTPTPTPAPALVLVGHVTWQGPPAQPNARQQLPITLTLCIGGTPQNYGATTDASGFFTVTALLPSGSYNWRVKGPKYLATSGTATLAGGGTTQVEMGQQKAGDVNSTHDNIVNTADFTTLKGVFGTPSAVGDLNNDGVTNTTDFALLKGTFGQAGAPVNCP